MSLHADLSECQRREGREIKAVRPPRRTTGLLFVGYALALLLSAYDRLNNEGILIAVFTVAFWGTFQLDRSLTYRRVFFPWLLFYGGIFLVVFFLVPAVVPAYRSIAISRCSSQLGSIGKALIAYDAAHQTLPPAFLADEQGHAMHSWRVLILPYLGEQALYDDYDFSEPWNGPNNRRLMDRMPAVYACSGKIDPAHLRPNCTSYVAVVDDSTAWPTDAGRAVSQIARRDGTSNTVLLVEIAPNDIPWLEPRDLSFESAGERLSTAGLPTSEHHIDGHRHDEFHFHQTFGRNILFADGEVRHLSHGIRADTWRKLLQFSDGEVVAPYPEPESRFWRQPSIGLSWRWANLFRTGLLVLLLVLPGALLAVRGLARRAMCRDLDNGERRPGTKTAAAQCATRQRV